MDSSRGPAVRANGRFHFQVYLMDAQYASFYRLHVYLYIARPYVVQMTHILTYQST